MWVCGENLSSVKRERDQIDRGRTKSPVTASRSQLEVVCEQESRPSRNGVSSCGRKAGRGINSAHNALAVLARLTTHPQWDPVLVGPGTVWALLCRAERARNVGAADPEVGGCPPWTLAKGPRCWFQFVRVPQRGTRGFGGRNPKLQPARQGGGASAAPPQKFRPSESFVQKFRPSIFGVNQETGLETKSCPEGDCLS